MAFRKPTLIGLDLELKILFSLFQLNQILELRNCPTGEKVRNLKFPIFQVAPNRKLTCAKQFHAGNNFLATNPTNTTLTVKCVQTVQERERKQR